ncbi:hypothetical protein [Hungatella sp.]|uniref:hypothetical protein n=1 Tax=Hungatella sp. TaxID=2613924 RepID=UPI002A82387F|nr:hypothetical protein [Hungatella sp.]
MLIYYKKNGQRACYDSENQPSISGLGTEPRPYGPFKSCGDCPYASHGFMCYGKEGDCLRTDMEKIHEKGRLTIKSQE